MSKTRMKRKAAEHKKWMADCRELILVALEKGFTTKGKISKSTGLKITELNNIFKEDRELWAEYTMYRRTLVDLAADNIADIIGDPTHKDHYQASKYVLATYKSDLDQTLEEKGDADNVTFEGSGKRSTRVTIKFKSKQKEED
jgi:hypothetical protein